MTALSESGHESMASPEACNAADRAYDEPAS